MEAIRGDDRYIIELGRALRRDPHSPVARARQVSRARMPAVDASLNVCPNDFDVQPMPLTDFDPSFAARKGPFLSVPNLNESASPRSRPAISPEGHVVPVVPEQHVLAGPAWCLGSDGDRELVVTPEPVAGRGQTLFVCRALPAERVRAVDRLAMF